LHLAIETAATRNLTCLSSLEEASETLRSAKQRGIVHLPPTTNVPGVLPKFG
jgi:hypothetical protein